MLGLLSVGASLLGAGMQSSAANKATDAQTDIANRQMAMQRRNQKETNLLFEPYRDAGTNALSAYNFEMGLGDAPQDYGGFQSSPGYQFQMDQGMRSLEGSAAAGGNLRSGATEKAILGYSQGLANQDYGNYMNRLSGMVNMGQASAGSTAAVNANTTAGVGNAMNNLGNAQSAGAIAQGNAWSSGLNNALSGYMMGQTAGGGMPSLNLPMGSAGSDAVFGSGSWF